MIGRSMVSFGFSASVTRTLTAFALVAFGALGSGCVVAEAAGLGDDDVSEDGSALEDVGYGGATGNTETEEQALVLKRGRLPDYAAVAGPQPDPWRSSGPQPDPWNPSAPPKPGNGKD